MQKCTCGNTKFTEVILTLHPTVTICKDGFVEHDYDMEDIKTAYPEPKYICEQCDTEYALLGGTLQESK